MASSGIKLTFKGFDDLIDNIQKAGGEINKAVDSAMKQAAQVQHDELKKQMSTAKFKTHTGISDGFPNRMPAPRIAWSGNKCTATIGFDKGAYNKNNPADAYKAIFLNYGTPRIAPTAFIAKAKKAAKPKIKKAQKEALEKILQRLGG